MAQRCAAAARSRRARGPAMRRRCCRAAASVTRTKDQPHRVMRRAPVARRAALPADSPALAPWANRAPLLVLGSHAWNAPNKAGRLACGPERQARVLRGAASGCGAVPASAPPGTACALAGLRQARLAPWLPSSLHGALANLDRAAELEDTSVRSARAPGPAGVAPFEPSCLSALHCRAAWSSRCLPMLLHVYGSVTRFVDLAPTLSLHSGLRRDAQGGRRSCAARARA